MSKRRFEFRIAALVVGAIALLGTFIAGLWGYVYVTTTPIHPDARAVGSVAGPAADPTPAVAEAVTRAREATRVAVAEQNLPGVSVAVAVGGKLVWAEGFGWADIEQHETVTPSTRFRIGTASKMLTSAAVGLLIEQGRLSLDDEIQRHVAGYPRKEWPVTLRQLMGHTAGIRRDAGDEEPIHTHCDRALDALPRFADAPLLFQPGTQYRYSSYGWILVSGAVEAAGKQPFDAFMRTQVFDVVGMPDTRTDAIVGVGPSQATYYFPRFGADTKYGPQGTDNEDFSCFSGASAFVSTPSDLVRFALGMQGGTLLRPDTVAMLQTTQRLTSGEATGYGLGWDLERVTLSGQQVDVIGYDGQLRDGTVMTLMIIPSRDLVVAVTTNTSFAKTPDIAAQIAEVFGRR